MLGVVLCGGQSTRMGSDKGLLKLHENTWAQTAIDKLNDLQLPVVISVSKDQYDSYSIIFSPQQLITDNNTLQLGGPLCGVLSVHIQYPQEDVLVLACDLPLMETGLIKELLAQYHQHPADDAFIYTNETGPEPLCGIYKAKGLTHFLHLYKTSQLPSQSMKYMLEHIATNSIPLPEDKKKCFRNFNTYTELNGL